MSGTGELTAGTEEKPTRGEPDFTRPEGGGAVTVAEGVTEWLDSIVGSFSDESTMLNDCFFAVLYVLMYESGFTVGGREHPGRGASSYDIRRVRECKEDFRRVSWKNCDSYTLDFGLDGLPQTVKLIAIPVGDLMIVDLLVPGLRVIGMSFRTGDYVAESGTGASFSNLGELSRVFKDAARSMSGAILRASGLRPPADLTSLPYEVLLKICSWLRPQAFACLALSCRQFYASLYNDELLWKRYATKYYKVDVLPVGNGTWKDFFLRRKRLDSKVKSYVWSFYENSGLYDCSPYSVDGVIML